MRITDTEGDEINRIPFDLDAGEESVALVLNVYPAAGSFLTSGPSSPYVTVMARVHGSGAPFVDVAAPGLDLSPYPVGDATQFDVKAVAATGFSGRKRFVLPLVVARSLQAGYLA